MKPRLPSSGIYAITDCTMNDAAMVLAKTRKILKTGVAILQYRNKRVGTPSYYFIASMLRCLCRRYRCLFIINDDVMLAQSLNADGVHLGKHDTNLSEARAYLGKSRIIGVSCYNDLSLAQQMQNQGADYIAFGAFYRSLTKPDAQKARPALLTAFRRVSHVPIVVIGGIRPTNVSSLAQAGADFLAVSSGLYRVADVTATLRRYQSIIRA